jgi:hypothetical protein
MKTPVFIVILFVAAGLVSCLDDRAPSGIEGTVLYGEGDCMPPVDSSLWDYEDYSGTLWFVKQADAVYSGGMLGDSLKALSDSTVAVDGSFNILLPPGSYYIMPDSMFYTSPNNLVTIEKEDLFVADLKFFRCTSY